MLPDGQTFPSSFDFYLHAASLFKHGSVLEYEVKFTQLAISVSRPIEISGLWYNLIKGLIDLGRFDDAYMALVSTPYDKM